MKVRDEVRECRELGEGELEERLAHVEEELMNLRFRHASGQLEQTSQFKTLRQRIARIRTVLREKQALEETEETENSEIEAS